MKKLQKIVTLGLLAIGLFCRPTHADGSLPKQPTAMYGLKRAPNKKLLFQKAELMGTKSAPITSKINETKSDVTLKSRFRASNIETMISMGGVWTDGTDYYISIHAKTSQSVKAPDGPSGTNLEKKIEYITLKGAENKPLGVANATRYGPYSMGYQLPQEINEALKKQNFVKVTIGHIKRDAKIFYRAPNIAFSLMLADKDQAIELPPTGTTPHSWAPGPQKDLAIFKTEMMDKIAELKNMIHTFKIKK